MSNPDLEKDYIPQPGESISPGALRTVANWLDTYDRMAEVFWDILDSNAIVAPERVTELREVTAGKQMQDDLRRWADELPESNPREVGDRG